MTHTPGEDPDLSPEFFAEEELASLGVSTVASPRRILPLEDEPTSLVARYLFPTERYRGEWKRHYIQLVKAIATVILLWLAGIRVIPTWVEPERADWAIATVSATATLLMFASVVSWFFNRLVLTNKRLMLVQGTFRRRVDTAPLLRTTDLRYTQTTLGRLLNYGTLQFVELGWRNRLHKVSDLPNPNELYLRMVEEMYEPQAVESRLGSALRHVLEGPTLGNYDGWLGLEVLANGQPVELSPDRRLPVEPGHEYELVVTISPDRQVALSEPLVVSDGVDRAVVEFTAEVDSDQPSLRRPVARLRVQYGGEARATFRLTADPFPVDPPPWLWVRVAQAQRIIQSIELEIDYGGPPEPVAQARGILSE